MPTSIKKTIVVIRAARPPTPRVKKDATRDAPEDPRLAIARDTIKARKVRPQAVISVINARAVDVKEQLTYLSDVKPEHPSRSVKGCSRNYFRVCWKRISKAVPQWRDEFPTGHWQQQDRRCILIGPSNILLYCRVKNRVLEKRQKIRRRQNANQSRLQKLVKRLYVPVTSIEETQ